MLRCELCGEKKLRVKRNVKTGEVYFFKEQKPDSSSPSNIITIDYLWALSVFLFKSILCSSKTVKILKSLESSGRDPSLPHSALRLRSEDHTERLFSQTAVSVSDLGRFQLPCVYLQPAEGHRGQIRPLKPLIGCALRCPSVLELQAGDTVCPSLYLVVRMCVCAHARRGVATVQNIYDFT